MDLWLIDLRLKVLNCAQFLADQKVGEEKNQSFLEHKIRIKFGSRFREMSKLQARAQVEIPCVELTIRCENDQAEPL